MEGRKSQRYSHSLHKHILISDLRCPETSNHKVTPHNSPQNVDCARLPLFFLCSSTHIHRHIQRRATAAYGKSFSLCFFSQFWPVWGTHPFERVELKEIDTLVVSLYWICVESDLKSHTFPLPLTL